MTNVAIAFVSEQDASQGATAPNSPTRHRVSYKITGSSFNPVPEADAKAKFQAALTESGIVGVQEIAANDGSGAASNSGSDASSKSGMMLI